MAAQARLGAYETRLSRLMNSHILDSVPRDDDYAAGIFLKLKLKRLIELRLVVDQPPAPRPGAVIRLHLQQFPVPVPYC